MKSRTPSSLKVDREIHDKILWFRERGLIKESIQEFVTNIIKEKLDILGRNQMDRIMREKLDLVIAEMGRMSIRLTNAEKKTHTRSRKDKHRK